MRTVKIESRESCTIKEDTEKNERSMSRRIWCFALALILLFSANAFTSAYADTFNIDFLNYMRVHNADESFIVSPLSYRAALLLALEGAGVETEAQLLRALGFSLVCSCMRKCRQIRCCQRSRIPIPRA